MSTSISHAKNQAKLLKSYLKESNSKISYSSCLHAVAKINGHKNWNTMTSVLENKQSDSLSGTNKKNPIEDDKKITISTDAFIHLMNEGTTGGFNVICYKIILFVLSQMKTNSALIPSKEVIQKSLFANVTKHDFDYAFNLLLKSHFLVTYSDKNNEDIYIINPHWAWKGSDESQGKFLREMFFDLGNRIDYSFEVSGYIAVNEKKKYLSNKELAVSFIKNVEKYNFPLELTFEFDSFGRDIVVANYSELFSNYDAWHIDNDKDSFQDSVDETVRKIFENTEFEEGINTQWCDDDCYLVEYSIEINNHRFKESLNILKHRYMKSNKIQ